jgi:3-dehydroquinate dehydratase-2
MANKKILLLNGPNLNLLGEREPHIYGSTTLKEIEENLKKIANIKSIELVAFQSNHEGELIDKIQELRKEVAGIIINPAGFSHTSIALRDALSAVSVPKVEVHISNIHAREAFRHHSYISAVVDCVICGAGVVGYEMALQWMIGKV